METLIYYTVYRTTNKVNGKIYIGVHETKNLDDGYMGSGTAILHAIEKYGIENFEKEILEFHESMEEMYESESIIVNREFVEREDTYNMKVGGQLPPVWKGYTEEEKKRILSENAKKGARALIDRMEKDEEFREKMREENRKKFLGKHHKEESKKKIGEANSIIQKGERNSQFGTKWIYNIELEQNKKIFKDELIPDGWESGRVINFKKYKEKIEFLEDLKLERNNKILQKSLFKLEERQKRKEKEEIKIQERIKFYNENFYIYEELGFKEFCRITGYDKSHANLVSQLKRYVKEFIPTQGKKRGK